MVAEILAVGTEILLGNIANTDAQDVSIALSEIGITVYYHSVVGDNPERVKQAVQIAKERADIIITTGGLGPTYDDLTKQTLAEAFGKKLVFDEYSAAKIRNLFYKRLNGREMPENNLLQAWLPEGCTIFENSCGTAPGCGFYADGVHVLMLPGPPIECRAMLKTGAIPYLRRLSDVEIHSHNIRIFAMGESTAENKLHNLMVKSANPSLAPYAKDAEVMLRVTARAENAEAADSMMAPVIEEVRQTLGDYVYGVDVESLEEVVFGLLKERGLTFCTAESCTGGLIAKRITDLPGSSAVFAGGVVTYSNEAKKCILGVPEKLLSTKGAVSEEVAISMAENARRLYGTDFAVSTTGIAGPDGDGSGKPIGLIYLALSWEGGTLCRELHCGAPRSRCRNMAANYAFDLLRRHLTGLTTDYSFI